MTLATSMLLGQRDVQVEHDTHSHRERLDSAISLLPSWIARMTWLTWRSYSGPQGHPAVQLPHW